MPAMTPDASGIEKEVAGIGLPDEGAEPTCLVLNVTQSLTVREIDAIKKASMNLPEHLHSEDCPVRHGGSSDCTWPIAVCVPIGFQLPHPHPAVQARLPDEVLPPTEYDARARIAAAKAQKAETEKERKKAARAAKKAAKAAKEREIALYAERLEAARGRLEQALLSVELTGLQFWVAGDETWGHGELSADEIKAKIEADNAAARAAYCEQLGERIPDRATAGWAAGKIIEAREWLKRTKRVQKALVNRAKAKLENREAFFTQALAAWAKDQPRDTEHGFRLEEANLRFEVRDTEPGYQVVDERAALEAAITAFKARTFFRVLETQVDSLFQGVFRVSVKIDKERLVERAARERFPLEGVVWSASDQKIKIVPMGR